MRALVCAIALAACSHGSAPMQHSDAPPGGGSGSDSGMACTEAPICTGWNVLTACGVSTTCPGGCFAGACKADACVDECALGETGPLGTCRLWNMASSSYVDADPAGSLHDRARDYERLNRKDHIAEGGVVATIYTAPDLKTLAAYDGLVDSALWTGTLLASHSWRYLATGSPDAAAHVAAIAKTLHVWMNLSMGQGYLARFASPEANAGPYNLNCANPSVHCNVTFDGVTYRWRGSTSQDAYTGVMLGLAFAYQASPDPDVRAMIREDVVRLVEALITERHGVPARVIINGLPIDKMIDGKFMILAPEEMPDGKLTETVDLGNLAAVDELTGLREFMPNLGPLVNQLVGVNLDIPRPASTMMLGAFYRMALAMTDSVPSMATRRAKIAADYDTEFEELATTAAKWSYGQTCGAEYFSTHIALIMAYTWTMLETDPARKTRLRDQVMDALWKVVGSHKNSYFTFLNAGSRSGFDADAMAAVMQLAQFQPGPRVAAARDHVAEYPHDANCTANGKPMASVAVDVGDRLVADFMWQRNPWKLYDGGNPVEVYAGVDYLAAYWAGRYHGFIADDHAGTCARWAP